MDLMAPLLAQDAASPRITTYTDRGRMELSATTAANWAAKGGNLCAGDLGLTPGDVVVVNCPTDWLPIALVLGCWQAGVAVCSTSSPGATSAAALITTDADAEFSVDFGGEILLLSTDPFGRGIAESGGHVPFGVTDLAPELRVQDDRYTGPLGSPDDVLLVNSEGRPMTGTELQSQAVATVGTGVRVIGGPWQDADSLVARLLALFSGGSVVLGGESAPDHTAQQARLNQLAAIERGVTM